MALLQTSGKQIVDGSKPVYLRGVNLGGWLNQEGFINGFGGSESEFRRAMLRDLGQERYDAFFNAHLESFVNEKDIEFLAGIGMNVVRLPVNYRMLTDSQEDIKFADAFHYIDSLIAWGKKYGVYTILDLHAAPGFQNSRWHCDNNASVSLLWNSKDFISQTVDMWKLLSDRYKDEPMVAGYDILNEPETSGSEGSLRKVYLRIIEMLRKNGDEHIVFLEGDRRGEDFTGLEDIPCSNVAYSVHFYIAATLHAGVYPGRIGGVYVDKAQIEKAFLARKKWIDDQGKPCYVGEFGLVIDHEVPGLSADDLSKIRALGDVIGVMNQHQQHWCIWTYKDLRYSGFVNVSPENSFAKTLKSFIELKGLLGVDPFISRKYGGVVSHAKAIVEETAAVIGRQQGDFSPDYGFLFKALGEQTIPLTVGNFINTLFTKNFASCSPQEIGDIVREGFAFERCVVREDLVKVLGTGL
jgi:hypothetical protein